MNKAQKFEKASYALKGTKIIFWNQYSTSNQIWDVQRM